MIGRMLLAIALTLAGCGVSDPEPGPDASPPMCRVPNGCPHGEICLDYACAKLCDAQTCPDGLKCMDITLEDGREFPVCVQQ